MSLQYLRIAQFILHTGQESHNVSAASFPSLDKYLAMMTDVGEWWPKHIWWWRLGKSLLHIGWRWRASLEISKLFALSIQSYGNKSFSLKERSCTAHFLCFNFYIGYTLSDICAYMITSMAITMRLAANDADLLLPIMEYPESYNRWCRSKGYDAGDRKTVSLPIQLLKPFNIS